MHLYRYYFDVVIEDLKFASAKLTLRLPVVYCRQELSRVVFYLNNPYRLMGQWICGVD